MTGDRRGAGDREQVAPPLVQHVVELAVYAEHLVELTRCRVEEAAIRPGRAVDRTRFVCRHAPDSRVSCRGTGAERVGARRV